LFIEDINFPMSKAKNSTGERRGLFAAHGKPAARKLNEKEDRIERSRKGRQE